jgi:hypothetical protein
VSGQGDRCAPPSACRLAALAPGPPRVGDGTGWRRRRTPRTPRRSRRRGGRQARARGSDPRQRRAHSRSRAWGRTLRESAVVFLRLGRHARVADQTPGNRVSLGFRHHFLGLSRPPEAFLQFHRLSVNGRLQRWPRTDARPTRFRQAAKRVGRGEKGPPATMILMMKSIFYQDEGVFLS